MRQRKASTDANTTKNVDRKKQQHTHYFMLSLQFISRHHQAPKAPFSQRNIQLHSTRFRDSPTKLRQSKDRQRHERLGFDRLRPTYIATAPEHVNVSLPDQRCATVDQNDQTTVRKKSLYEALRGHGAGAAAIQRMASSGQRNENKLGKPPPPNSTPHYCSFDRYYFSSLHAYRHRRKSASRGTAEPTVR